MHSYIKASVVGVAIGFAVCAIYIFFDLFGIGWLGNNKTTFLIVGNSLFLLFLWIFASICEELKERGIPFWKVILSAGSGGVTSIFPFFLLASENRDIYELVFPIVHFGTVGLVISFFLVISNKEIRDS